MNNIRYIPIPVQQPIHGLNGNTVLRVVEHKTDTGHTKQYAITANRFVSLAGIHADITGDLQQQLQQARKAHEELNRCAIVINKEQ